MTRLDAAQSPLTPHVQHQGPAGHCVIHGHDLSWLSCTAYAMAMGMDKSTNGRVRISGCQVRDETGDYIGGTTLPQVAAVAEAHGIHVDVHVGAGVATPAYAATQLQAGRGFVLQGNAGALVHTPFRSTRGPVDHAVWVNNAIGGSLGHPAFAKVFDPAADGHKAAWGTADSSPGLWPWSLVEQFALELHPWGDDDNRLLGPGKFYAGFLPDTEPHVSLVKGATKAHPFPDRVRAADPNDPTTAIHSKPGGEETVTRRVKNGTLLRLYQYRDGWGYNDDGTECVKLSNTSHVGGPT